jgi:hypothetical protein
VPSYIFLDLIRVLYDNMTALGYQQTGDQRPMTLNSQKLSQVVTKAKEQIKRNPKLSRIEKAAWTRSITKAEEQLLSNPYIHVMDNGDVLMLSLSSGQTYTVNGKCVDEKGHSCKGYEMTGLCYHRTVKRLLERYQQSSAPASTKG